MKPSIAVVGPGRMGQSLCRLLADAGYPFVAIISRDAYRARTAARFIGHRAAASTTLASAGGADIVLLTVPDDDIAKAAQEIYDKGNLRDSAILIHCSGLHQAAILKKEGQPQRTLSLHPLQTFADAVIGVRNLPGSIFTYEGDTECHELAIQLIQDLQGTPKEIRSDQKALYHASACTASNYFVTLADSSFRMMTECGFSYSEAREMLLGLIHGTMRSLSMLEPTQALTGPIARGDSHTIEQHLQVLQAVPEELQLLYREMGKRTLTLSEKKGHISEKDAENIRSLLK